MNEYRTAETISSPRLPHSLTKFSYLMRAHMAEMGPPEWTHEDLSYLTPPPCWSAALRCKVWHACLHLRTPEHVQKLFFSFPTSIFYSTTPVRNHPSHYCPSQARSQMAPTSSCTSSGLVGGSLVRKFHHRSPAPLHVQYDAG